MHYIADVAGGQGMLSRSLRRRCNYESEVVDPRGYMFKRVPNRAEEFAAGRADCYDLIIGLYTDDGVAYERVIFPFKGPKTIGSIVDP